MHGQGALAATARSSQSKIDIHNFNKKVFKAESYFHKPRCVNPEFQFLSKHSAFREFAESTLAMELTCLPIIQFGDVDYRPSLGFQKMEAIEVEPILRELNLEEIDQIAAVLCLLNLIGAGDLNRENFIFGLHDQRFCFVPIDLEVYFQTSNHFESGFFSNQKHLRCCSGLSLLIDHLEEFPDSHFVPNLISAYHNHLKKLYSHKEKIWNLFSTNATHTRRIIHPTGDYYQSLQGQSDIEYTAEEQEQLSRGDIPYFFSFLESPSDLYQWISETAYEKVQSHLPVSFQIHSGPNYISFEKLLDCFIYIAVLIPPRQGSIETSALGGVTVYYKNTSALFQGPWGYKKVGFL